VQFNNIAGSKGRFLGFWAVLTQAAFSFIGTEIVAVSAELGINMFLLLEISTNNNFLRLQLVKPKTQDVICLRLFKEFTFVSSH